VERGTRVSNLVGEKRGRRRHGVREESQGRHPIEPPGRGLGPGVASMLTTIMGGVDDKVSIVMETIAALQNTNGLVAWWPSRGWMEARGGGGGRARHGHREPGS
jgi:hypothetical protein